VLGRLGIEHFHETLAQRDREERLSGEIKERTKR